MHTRVGHHYIGNTLHLYQCMSITAFAEAHDRTIQWLQSELKIQHEVGSYPAAGIKQVLNMSLTEIAMLEGMSCQAFCKGTEEVASRRHVDVAEAV